MALSKDDIIKEIVEKSYLNANCEFKHPPTCLEISGQYGKQIFASLGNFSTILAPPKVGKTTVTGVLVGGLLTGKNVSNFIPSLPIEKNVVVWIDTEQGSPECVKTIRSICKQISGNETEHPANLIFSSLRKHSKDVRLNAIEYILETTDNVGFLVIDGVRDLVSSINNEIEATLIADKLLKWSQEYNIHILTILHQNKGDDNARGHLGTELMNKAETVANLKRGDNNGTRTTIFEPKLTRHKEFEAFAFTVGDDGIVIQAEIKSKEFEPKNPTVEQLTVEEITDTITATFNKCKNLPYAKCWEGLQQSLLSTHKISFGVVKAKDLLTFLNKNNYIIQNELTKHYFPNIPH